MSETETRFSFLTAISEMDFYKKQKPGADQYALWLAHYCGALRARLILKEHTNEYNEAYNRWANQRALLVGIGLKGPVVNLELKVYQDWIRNKKT